VSGRPSSLMVEEPKPPTNGRQIIAARTLFGHNCPGGKELLAALSSVERRREQQRSLAASEVPAPGLQFSDALGFHKSARV
jgi:hypothetical protein